MNVYTRDNFSDIYHMMLRDVYWAHNSELIGLSYYLTDPTKVEVINKKRTFNLEYAEELYEWIVSGSDDMSVLKKHYPFVAKFDREVRGRNTFYGPRILNQIDGAVAELLASPESRRACVMILDAEDIDLLPDKRDGDTIEYPCTVMLNYFVRGDELHASTFMRSNNMTTVVCYDNYNFCKLQQYVLTCLNEGGLDLKLGYYLHMVLNAHIVPAEDVKTLEILKEYFGEAY